MATLVRKSFTDKQIKQIARKYIFGKGMTYKKLAKRQKHCQKDCFFG